MRLGGRENADQGILLAATTEHFLSCSFLAGRLFPNKMYIFVTGSSNSFFYRFYCLFE